MIMGLGIYIFFFKKKVRKPRSYGMILFGPTYRPTPVRDQATRHGGHLRVGFKADVVATVPLELILINHISS
eukprot:SAG31_NODE_368_length_16798_cov_20.422780_14_plen_72_part_00